MKIKNICICVSACLSAAASRASYTARDIEVVYVRNNDTAPAFVWIDKVYQGGVAPGETCWLSAAGVELDEGGTHAAGWERRNRLEIRLVSYDEAEGMKMWSGPLKIFNAEAFMSGGTGPHARARLGGTDSDGPSDWDVINSEPCLLVPAPAPTAEADLKARPTTGASATLQGE